MSNTNYCTFYIIRHGQTEWNLKQIIQGHKDSPLTETGMQVAKQHAKKLKKIQFDAIFSSDSLRAKQTAEIIALERSIAIKTTQLLRERSFGKYEGRSLDIFTNELRQMVGGFEELSDQEKKKHKYPTMESDEQIIGRFITFLREIAVAYPSKTVLVISHSVIISALLIHLGYMKYHENPTYLFPHDSYLILESDGVDFDVKEVRKINT
ncbi:MAG: histidine phosphatase family protein [Patescibacteria group bacterium]